MSRTTCSTVFRHTSRNNKRRWEHNTIADLHEKLLLRWACLRYWTPQKISLEELAALRWTLHISPPDTLFIQIINRDKVISSQSFPINAAPLYVSICRLQEEVGGWFHLAGCCAEQGYIKRPVNWQWIILTDQRLALSLAIMCRWMARKEVRTAGQRVIGLFFCLPFRQSGLSSRPLFVPPG